MVRLAKKRTQNMIKDNSEDIIRRYSEELSKKIALESEEYFPGETFSLEYKKFRKENLEKNLSHYERLCNYSEKIIKISPDKKDIPLINESIEKLQLDISPEGAMSFAVLIGLSIMLLGFLTLFVPLAVLFILEQSEISSLINQVPIFIPFLFLLSGILLIKPLSKYPLKLADNYRLKISNQMVLCILYIITYMRHTSNLENAIRFAGEHLSAPLSLDLRKILWDVETGTFVTIKDSLDNYLKYWKQYNLEFIESFHLIEGSLYEPDEIRRIKLLDKSLELILQSVYERMLHFAQDLKTPITMLHMLGVILPILGLVIFPLLGSFLGGLVKWYHISLLYNIILPISIITIGNNLLMKRPTGYSESTALSKRIFAESEKSTFIGKEFNIKFLSIFIGCIFILIGISPILIHFFNPSLDQAEFLWFKLLDFKCQNNKCLGPYSTFSLLISLFVPFGLSIAIGLYYYLTTKDSIKIRKETLTLEREFTSALFQLGNRVGDGIPIESAFNQVSENMKNTPSGDFLKIIDYNIRNLGMNVKEAIFNTEKGAITYYPSSLIESSMKVMIQSAKKSPLTVAKSLITISNYVKKIHSVNERLKDLLSDIISSMKSQISFLTPMIAGIVIAVGSMITTIINLLSEQFSKAATFAPDSQVSGIAALPKIIDIKDVIPGFYFQIIIGIYVIQIGIILTILASGIENGIDRLTEKNQIGKNTIISTLLYIIISLIGIIVFSFLASGISQFSTA